MDCREVQKILSGQCGVEGDRPLLVGVSGGADSLCLLSLLSSMPYPVVAAYFDHRLRPESTQEAQIVARFAARMECRFVSGSGEVSNLAQAEGLSLEAAARRARYTFLFEQARLTGAQAVAVAHTADDQVETILLHLLRGSGLDGLKGMSYRTYLQEFSPEIPLIRPLLGSWRVETEAYCAEHGLQPLEDRTNRDRRFLRNRLRHELIPELQSYNPEIKERLWTLGQVAQSSLSGLEEIEEWIYRRCLISEQGGRYAVFARRDLLDLNDTWQARILRAAAVRVHRGPADLDHKAVQRGLTLLRRKTPTGQVDLNANLQLIQVHGRFYVADRRFPLPTGEWPQIDGQDELALDLPGQLQLGEGWWLRAERLPIEPGALAPDDPLEAWLDSALIQPPLAVRAWRAGDRFQPIGMSGSVRVADFFTNQKVPRIARSRWPLVFAGEELIWVAGLRISEKYRLTPGSRLAVRLKLEREKFV